MDIIHWGIYIVNCILEMGKRYMRVEMGETTLYIKLNIIKIIEIKDALASFQLNVGREPTYI